MNHTSPLQSHDPVWVRNADGVSSVVLVCEHASRFIPDYFHDLGMSADDLASHAVWDPGAAPVAAGISDALDAPLVGAGISRLVYDCNRPPSALDAMPEKSERIIVPGNRGLTPTQRRARTTEFYDPFRNGLASTIAGVKDPKIVTIHSFTPVYKGATRTVEIGILHDADQRLADAMLHTAKSHTNFVVERNQPYGPQDGVTHTLKEHALCHGHANVMIEIRNDLISTEAQQTEVAKMLTGWLTDAVSQLETMQ
ncbi:MAG: N-formylglutamate amidohydrolase [Pseudoruegeria sp.]